MNACCGVRTNRKSLFFHILLPFSFANYEFKKKNEFDCITYKKILFQKKNKYYKLIIIVKNHCKKIHIEINNVEILKEFMEKIDILFSKYFEGF